MTTMCVSGWMFLLVPVHPGCPRQNPQSRKRLCMCVCIYYVPSVLWCCWLDVQILWKICLQCKKVAGTPYQCLSSLRSTGRNSVRTILNPDYHINSHQQLTNMHAALHFPLLTIPYSTAWDVPFNATSAAHCCQIKPTHTHTHQPFYGPLGFCPGLLGWAGTRKVKPRR